LIHSSAACENILCSAYDEEAGLYTRALQLTEETSSTCTLGQNANEKLAHVARLLDAVAAVEERIAGTKSLWRQLNQHPGAQLVAATAHVKELISRLTIHIQQAERQASAQRNLLVPELEAIARAHQMQQAYRMWR
jgi:hypothetical protein